MLGIGTTLVLTACQDPADAISTEASSGALEAYVGETASSTLTITNNGTDTFTFSSISKSEVHDDTEGDQFSLEGDATLKGVTLSAGGSASLKIIFRPTYVGKPSSTVSFNLEGGVTVSQDVAAIGLNNLPEVQFKEAAPAKVCQSVPFRVSFQVSDVEDSGNLKALAYTLTASVDGKLASGQLATDGTLGAALTLEGAGTQELLLSVTDSHQGTASLSHSLQVDDIDLNGDGVPDCQDQDADGFSAASGDCNDTDPEIHPGATDTCSGVDENCDGEIDPMPSSDGDGDGTSDCVDDDEDGHTEKNGDCDDSSPTRYPGATETCNGLDDDCNTVIDDYFDSDHDGQFPLSCTGGTDCDDTSASVYAGATELCNGIDDNCTGGTDEGFDADSDGFFVCTIGMQAADCNDSDASIYPGATEVCDGFDQDCNGIADNGFDLDSDGFFQCDVGPLLTDCNDQSETIYPGANELCNGTDDDCDLSVDEDAAFDVDQDGFTYCGGDCDDASASTYPGAAEACNQVDDNCNSSIDEGYDGDSDGHFSAALCPFGDDCDDGTSATYPGADEACNGRDDNCDTHIDEGYDVDRDGHLSAIACATGTDCDDLDGTVNPDAPELCDSKDNDCNGESDETDADGDGYGACALSEVDCNDFDGDIYPGASETCNLIDDDCDGNSDEDFDNDGDGHSTCAGDCDDNNASVQPSIIDSGWVDFPCNPVLSVSTVTGEDTAYADQASIVQDFSAPSSERYKAWYRYGASSTSLRIGYATSPDGISWTKHGVVLSPGTTGSFDEGRLNYPSVLFHDGKFRMWYHGTDKNGANLQIGYATSVDGISWTRENSGKPVLPKGPAEAWDDKSTQAPTVVFHEQDSLYYMWYGGNSNSTAALQIGLATSPDGIVWQRRSAPVLTVGSQGEWDSFRVNFARVLDNGDHFEMRYSGTETGTVFEIGTATSTDGITWERGDVPVLSPGSAAWNAGLVYSPMTRTSVDSEARILYSMWYGAGPGSSGPFQTGLAFNYQPAVQIVAPYDGSRYTVNDAVTFQSYVNDPWLVETVRIVASSDLQGVLSGNFVNAQGLYTFKSKLSVGTHTITFTAIDSGGLSDLDQIVVHILE